jgi:hypothetical protein
MYLEGHDTEDQQDHLSSIRLRGFSENSPEIRFHRLLRRRRFEEAFTFAKRFHLPEQEVYKSKMMWLSEELSPWKKCDNKDELFAEFKSILVKITDYEFVARCSVTAFMPTLDHTREILLLGTKLIENNDVSSTLLTEMSKTLQKMETFCSCESNHEPDEWITFSRTPVLKICKKYLQVKDLDSFLLVWTRHWPDISKEFNDREFLLFLELVPEDWTEQDRGRFFENFLPDCLEVITFYGNRSSSSRKFPSSRLFQSVYALFANGRLNP